MIQVINLCAGLANRMFQYAFYLNLKKRGVNALMADNSIVKELKHEDVSITDIFPNVKYSKASPFLIFILGGGNDIFSRALRTRLKLYSPFFQRTGAEDGFKASILNLNHIAFHSGVYQSELYFKESENAIRESFLFKEFANHSENQLLQLKIQSENSIAIHVRKGKDYCNGKPYQNTCPIEYYQKAITYIKEHVLNPVFYVFTDNPIWVKENLGKTLDYTLIDWNPAVGYGNHFDMQLMSCAKHNIIANSTYSWWGAWLNPNPDKIVIGPKQWFNPEDEKFNQKEDLQIIPESWIKI